MRKVPNLRQAQGDEVEVEDCSDSGPAEEVMQEDEVFAASCLVLERSPVVPGVRDHLHYDSPGPFSKINF